MQSRIAANPHIEPADARDFVETLLNERRSITGFERADDVIDHEGIARLKQIMRDGKAIKVS